MLIEGAGVEAYRIHIGAAFFTKTSPMKRLLPIILFAALFTACHNKPEHKGTTIVFAENEEQFANPERGLLAQIYYTSANLNAHADASVINKNRSAENNLTLYLHSYYLTDYMESDIPQEFLDRLQVNMDALREGGGKVVCRFSYKSSMEKKDQPWDAQPEWMHRHIDQITPYLQKNADVILCVQCGFIGSWGEWYYTNAFKFNPSRDEDFVGRWELLDHVLRAVPQDRQVALRCPGYKMRYLRMHELGDSALTAAEAFQPTPKARLCGHNDCFVSSANDVGTYFSTAEREFWAEDSKYTLMGGETCDECVYSHGDRAIKEMERYHWTYINRDYHPAVAYSWRQDGSWPVIVRRLGYRLALDKIIVTSEPKAGQKYEVYCELHNSGFAAPMNKRDVELIFVNANNPEQKFIYPQTEDPRFWLPGEEHKFTLACNLDSSMQGDYKLYLTLPDPYPSLHEDPRYSIRLANDSVWEEATGYNYLTTITVN